VNPGVKDQNLIRSKVPMQKQIVFLKMGLLSGLLWFLLSLVGVVTAQQEEPAVNIEDAEKQAQAKGEGDYTKEEYEEFQKILNNSDLKARAEGLIQFITAHPKSKLSEHGMSVLPTILPQLYEQKNMTALASVSESFLGLKPDDLAALGYVVEATYSEKDYTKAVKYGEALYAKKPTVQIAQLLAQSYELLKNEPKFAEYAEKCVAALSPQDGFYYSAKLAHYYVTARRDVGRSSQYFQKVVSAYGEEIPPGYNATSWSQEKAFAYSIIGRNAFDRKQYAAAVAAYNNSLRLYRQNDEAYYYLGRSYWGANDTITAMKAFAKGYSLNKPYSKKCREGLEVLYKALHNGTLEGIDAFVRTSSADMK
jgi:tetratricopeptide (TPR) repeat protein